MGVDNLLSFVKNATKTSHIKRIGIANSTAAVDISHWIYKAAYNCPEALYHRNNVHDIYRTVIKYIDNYVKLLQFYNVQLTIVFDGMKLPAKHMTHKERATKKAEARKMVEQCLARNDKAGARKNMLRCMEIKFDIIEQIIFYLQREGISYIVAPYEADAQLAFLSQNNLCEFIITEDTDLILYGCQKIVYKMSNTGECLLYERSRLGKCFAPNGDRISFEKFRRMCILSGCDYLKNIPGVGLQSAKKFFLPTKQDNIRLLLPKLSTYLKSPKLAGKMTEEYINGFIDAENTFRHHIVYDPVNERLTPIEPYPKGRSSSDFPQAGKRFCRVMAKDLSQGRINLDDLDPEADLDDASDISDDETDCEGHQEVATQAEFVQKHKRASVRNGLS